MEVSVALLLELGVILIALTVLGSAARRFALSPIPLYLLAGLALGNGGIAPVPAAGEFVSTGASNPLSLSLTTSPVVFTIGRTAGHGCQGARLPRRKFRHRSGAPTTMTSTADHTGVPVI